MPQRWTLSETELLQKLWPDTPTKEVAKLLNRSVQSCHCKAKLMQLQRSEEFKEKLQQYFAEILKREGVKTRFVKGQESYNKGKKMEEWMSPESMERVKKTHFPKYNKPVNTVPIGTERIAKDGYIEIKVRESYKGKNFEYKQRVIYEQHFGKVPKGFIVGFKDGDIYNFEPSNLVLKSKLENLLDNQISDTCLIKRMTKEKDPAKIEIIKQEAKELIQVKRATVLLNRKIKENDVSRKT